MKSSQLPKTLKFITDLGFDSDDKHDYVAEIESETKFVVDFLGDGQMHLQIEDVAGSQTKYMGPIPKNDNFGRELFKHFGFKKKEKDVILDAKIIKQPVQKRICFDCNKPIDGPVVSLNAKMAYTKKVQRLFLHPHCADRYKEKHEKVARLFQDA